MSIQGVCIAEVRNPEKLDEFIKLYKACTNAHGQLVDHKREKPGFLLIAFANSDREGLKYSFEEYQTMLMNREKGYDTINLRGPEDTLPEYVGEWIYAVC